MPADGEQTEATEDTEPTTDEGGETQAQDGTWGRGRGQLLLDILICSFAT